MSGSAGAEEAGRADKAGEAIVDVPCACAASTVHEAAAKAAKRRLR